MRTSPSNVLLTRKPWQVVLLTVVAPNPCPENKELLIIPDASHCDLYDGGYTEPAGKGEPKNLIPGDKLTEFFNKNLK